MPLTPMDPADRIALVRRTLETQLAELRDVEPAMPPEHVRALFAARQLIHVGMHHLNPLCRDAADPAGVVLAGMDDAE